MKAALTAAAPLLGAFVWLAFSACTEELGVSFGKKNEGESCRQVSDCKAGLDCKGGTCVPLPPAGDNGRGQSCADSSGCEPGLCCGNQGVCRTQQPTFMAGECGLRAGRPCGFAADCDVGLVCSGGGVCAAGGPGTAGIGDACEEFTDCRRPLLCGADHTCSQLPFFPGARCTRSDEERGVFRMYFEVPKTGMVADEFYRLPFPSDVRFKNGKLDLSGHASPGEIGGIDFTRLYLEALEDDADGFGLSSPIFARFSGSVDPLTISVNTATRTVFLVNVSPESPRYRQELPVQWRYLKDKGLFICQNALVVAPIDGRPLEKRTRYALVIKSDVRSTLGDAPIHDGDFDPLLSAEAPDDPDLAHAHQVFEPLRTYLSDEGLSSDQIAGATVFTTGDPGAIGPKIREVIRSQPAPVLGSLVRCITEATASPCDAPATEFLGERGCQTPGAGFHHLQAVLKNPILQKGTRPYLLAGDDGKNGAFELDANGLPIVQGAEDLCLTISIPTGTMPAGGWPVVIYGHGTGGHYLSGMGSIAGSLANISEDGGAIRAQVAMIGYDGVSHATRQGLPPAAWMDPGPLFFNVPNPRAARDNVLQGAADVFNLVYFAETAVLQAAATGLPALVRFNPGAIIFYGHSQGTVVTPPVLAFEPALRAAVWTGAGAELGLSILEKKKPNDVSALTRVAFGDQGISRLHPIIGLLSFYFGPSDALPYAPLFAKERPANKQAVDVLHLYGLKDLFTPESSQQALIRAMEAPLIRPILRPVSGTTEINDVVQGNLNGASLATMQFEPPLVAGELAYDGHFVGFQDPAGKSAIMRFIATAATSRNPALIRRRTTP